MTQRHLLTSISALVFYATAAYTNIVVADTRTYQATTDFPILDAGAAPYYSEEPNRPSLAINAENVEYRDVFARAEVVYDGNEGIHELTLVALAELDGEADYRVLVNDVVVGEATNPTVSVDYTIVRHTFTNIAIPVGATLAVESLANTNGTIPEGDGTAYARGRWSTLEMLEQDASSETPTPNTIDLSVGISSNKQSLGFNEDFELELVLSNDINSLTATQPIVSVAIPLQTLTIASADQCTQTALGFDCAFPELPAGNSYSMTLSLSSTDQTVAMAVQARSTADQDDREETNNIASINIDIADRELEPEPETPDAPQTTDISASVSNKSGGGISLFWYLLLVNLTHRLYSQRSTRCFDKMA